MGLLGLGEGLEPVGDVAVSLFAGRLGHAGVHLGVLVGLAGHRGGQVLHGVADGQAGGWIADDLDVVEVAVGVSGLAFRGVAEVAGDVGVALDVGHLGEVEVAAVGLRLAGEGGLQVLERLAAVKAHDGTPDSLVAGRIRSRGNAC